jgi:serine/threonine protein kinase
VNLGKTKTPKVGVNQAGGDSKVDFKIPKLNTVNLVNQVVDDDDDDEVDQDGKKTKRGPKLNEDAVLTIVDMGNGCWTHHHYTSEIQTRQYRSPETIIGVPYGTSADIWSLGCMVFELLTGDFAFEPKKGENYDKDDDHLAQMIELLGPMPKNFALSGKNSRRFFDSSAHLRKIRGLNYWPLRRVLIEKYKYRPAEAEPLADFLNKCFSWEPEKRATAEELLDHEWFKMGRNYDFKLGEEEYETMIADIKKKEDAEKRKKELEIILNEGSFPPEIMAKKINSVNNSELAEDDFELYAADVEDDFDRSVVSDSEESISLGFGDSDQEGNNLFEGGGYGKGKALNNSFSGPYNNMDHIHRDKGENTQFDKVE